MNRKLKKQAKLNKILTYSLNENIVRIDQQFSLDEKPNKMSIKLENKDKKIKCERNR